MTNLRIILNDQLNEDISSLRNCVKSEDIILMCEVMEEFSYVKQHKKKIVFLISSMRHFRKKLEDKGYNVIYVQINDKNNTGSITEQIGETLKEIRGIKRIIITYPGEYRVLKYIETWEKKYSLPVVIIDDNRFLCDLNEFKFWFSGKKRLRMEYFYREMRRKYSILMEGGKPVGGKWNYDSENRKFPKKDIYIPKEYKNSPDNITKEVINIVNKLFSHNFGNIQPFYFAINREQAISALNQFIGQRLTKFGQYQDAMVEKESWMFHSHISFYLNIGFLLPLECIKLVEKSYYNNLCSINSAEGFIRQILGWREFIRCIYWFNMPGYSKKNFLDAKKRLPSFYWTGDTKMNCLKQCITTTRKNAYAHHIQRLMVLGNFALIAGINPKEVSQWFLSVYADAYEWVELPNVIGMILFADGGIVGSKPYASGGNYINKMSDYCKSCSYKVATKNGANACPFNYLYWNFLIRNKSKFKNNPRVTIMYKTYEKMSKDKKELISKDSKLKLKS